MDIAKIYGTDKKAETEGKWVELGDGLSVKVARANNPRTVAMLRKETKPHRLLLSTESEAAQQLAREINIRVTAHTILLGWKNLEYKGEELEYNIENATKILTELPDFLNVINELSGNMFTFQKEEDEIAAKNSVTS